MRRAVESSLLLCTDCREDGGHRHTTRRRGSPSIALPSCSGGGLLFSDDPSNHRGGTSSSVISPSQSTMRQHPRYNRPCPASPREGDQYLESHLRLRLEGSKLSDRSASRESSAAATLHTRRSKQLDPNYQIRRSPTLLVSLSTGNRKAFSQSIRTQTT